MAIRVKMHSIRMILHLVLVLCLFFVSGNESEDTNNSLIEKVLKHLNDENNTKYRYQTGKLLETHIHNGESYFLMDVTTTCLDANDDSCDPIEMVCQGGTEHDTLSVVKCFLKEEFPALPTYDQGFIIKRSNSFIEEVLEHGLQKLERDGGPKRRMMEILSVKKREMSSTELFITAKVTAGSEEGGDQLELEMCELAAILGTPGSMQILDTETKCFPLTDDPFNFHLGGASISTGQLMALANWAKAKINHGTNLVFNYTLVEVIKADASNTPGSGGELTTLQVRLAPSKCPKHSAVSEVEWECPATGEPLICTVSVWQRPWRGDTLLSRPRCKRLPVHKITAQRGSTDPPQQRPGFCTGCLEEVNKEDPKVAELASTAVQQLNAGQLSASPHQLLRIVSAHRQVVNGIRYVLNVELAPCSGDTVPCEVAEETQGGLQCRLELLEGSVDRQRTLLSSLCQPRVQTGQTTFSETAAATEKTDVAEPITEETSFSVAPVQEEAPAEMPEMEQADAPASSSEEDKDSSEEKPKKERGSSEEQESSEEQGQKEEMGEMHYSKPHNTKRRAKRASGLLGSLEDVDLEKEGPAIQKLANMALSSIDDIDDDPSRRKLLAVVSAKKQVVNGILYHLTLRVGVMPPCDDGEEDCLDGGLPSLLCKVQVHQAAADTKQGEAATRVMRSECEPEGSVEVQEAPERPESSSSPTKTSSPNSSPLSRQRRSRANVASNHAERPLAGGRRPANVSDPFIQEMAQFALSELDRVSNSLFRRQVVKIVSAEKQVVAGTLTHLTMELAYSDCRKGDSHNEVCSLQNDVDGEICTASVWDRPWLKARELQNFTCARVAQTTARNKREAPLLGHDSHDIHIGMFRDFVTRHGKQYASNEEFHRRFHIFRANMHKIKLLQEMEQGTARYGPTQFADLTSKEFKKQYLGLNHNVKERSKLKMKKAVIPDIQLPTEFDWRHYNVVTPVKNQGSCGSCWAFSVTGNVEGQWALRRGKLLSLSEQELVDCDKLDDGCNGGLPTNAYEAIQKLGGLETEDEYPYEGHGETCHFNKTEVEATVTGALNITTNETAMAQWLVKNGPISIGINANAMQFYFGGVSHPWKMLCDPADLDHGVLIVGYGVHTYPMFNKTLPFWTIKNSWGPTWGEQGYYRVYRGDGTCGVNQMASSAIVG